MLQQPQGFRKGHSSLGHMTLAPPAGMASVASCAPLCQRVKPLLLLLPEA